LKILFKFVKKIVQLGWPVLHPQRGVTFIWLVANRGIGILWRSAIIGA